MVDVLFLPRRLAALIGWLDRQQPDALAYLLATPQRIVSSGRSSMLMIACATIHDLQKIELRI